MGERSYLGFSTLNLKDKKRFTEWLVAEKAFNNNDDGLLDSVKFKHPKDEEYYNGDLYLSWQDWKIHGYWYSDFCDFVLKLQELGVRGVMGLSYTNGQDYNILFSEKGVYVLYYTEPQYDDDYEEILNEKEIEEKGVIDIMQLVYSKTPGMLHGNKNTDFRIVDKSLWGPILKENEEAKKE
jgi:hypothetical protein